MPAIVEFVSESDLAARLLQMNEADFSSRGIWLSGGRLVVAPQPLPSAGMQLRVERATPMEGHGSIPPRFVLSAQTPSGARRWNATLVGRMEREVLVASRAVRRGDPLSCNNFEVHRKAWTADTEVAVTPPCALEGSAIAGRYLAAGDVLRPSDAKPDAAVAEMAPVSIRVVVGKVILDAPGIALEGGNVGDRVRVRPNASRHSMLATVSGPRNVVVE